MINDDNMERYYNDNPLYYEKGLMRIGCLEEQAITYSKYF